LVHRVEIRISADPNRQLSKEPFQDLLNSIILRGRSAKISEDKTTVMMSLWLVEVRFLVGFMVD
jgi:hypothetical protein